MIQELAEMPDVFKNHEKGDIYYMLHNTDAPYAYINVNFTYAPVAILHVEVIRFSHNIFRWGIEHDWQVVVDECQKHDCSTIYITSPGTLAQKDKLIRFCKHFGFKQFSQHIAAHQFIGEENG